MKKFFYTYDERAEELYDSFGRLRVSRYITELRETNDEEVKKELERKMLYEYIERQKEKGEKLHG